MNIFYLYILLASFTLICCLYVMISYMANRSYRKPPAGLMFSKTAADLVFSSIFFFMLFVVNHPTIDNQATIQCDILGATFIVSFIASQAYFTVMCRDLHQTLSNPFRKSGADSMKSHLFVWLFSAILVLAVSPFNVFRYRRAYGICFTCNTGPKTFNVYNLILFYIPMLVANGSGSTVTVFAFKRLLRGLPQEFELRKQLIKRQLILVGFLAVLSLITVITWCILIYSKSFQQPVPTCNQKTTSMLCVNTTAECSDDTIYPDTPRILLAVLVFLNGGVDAVTWYLLQKLAKAVQIMQHQPNNQPKLEINKMLKPKHLSDALRKQIITIVTKGITLSLQNNTKEQKQYCINAVSMPANNDDYILLPDDEKNYSIPLVRVGGNDINIKQDRFEYWVNTDNKSISFMSYAESIFSYLRCNAFDTNDITYQQSILPVNDIYEIILQLVLKFNEANQSNSFYFWSYDQQYLLKTLSKQEAMLLLDILDKYAKYMTGNKESYLPKYYGLFSFQLHGQLVYIVVIRNMFPPNYLNPDEKYEIKGCWIDRHANTINVTDSELLKDSDMPNQFELILNEQQSAAMYEQLLLDTKFLEQNGLMDYALLLGIWNSKIFIHNRYKSVIHLDKNDSDELKMDDENDNRDNTMNLHIYDVYDAPYIEGPGRYCIGIIDTLQQWDSTKKAERMLKVYWARKDPHGISSVEPSFYRKRFLRKMENIGIRDSNKNDHISNLGGLNQ